MTPALLEGVLAAISRQELTIQQLQAQLTQAGEQIQALSVELEQAKKKAKPS